METKREEDLEHMKEGARYRAVAEILTEVFKDKEPADNIINAYMRGRKYIGSKDRRFISEKVWEIIRHRRRLAFEAGSEDVLRMLLVRLRDEDLDLIFGADDYALPAVSKEEKAWLKNPEEKPYPADVEAECPQWLFEKIGDMALLKSLNEPASADFRINNGGRESVLAALRREGLFLAPTPYSPIGIRSTERVNLKNCMAYLDGDIEVQDEASQIAAILCGAEPGMKIMDYCAGAGGKSLTMMYLMHNKGKVFVHDVNVRRLEALFERAERLHAKSYEVVREAVDRDYDLFVVDAPCSGSGTWRRSPDAKYRLTKAGLKELNRVQSEVLEKAYEHTRRGGKIVYITCSVLREENEEIVQKFREHHTDVQFVDLRREWEERLNGRYPGGEEGMLRFSPLTTGTDGFFVSVMWKL